MTITAARQEFIRRFFALAEGDLGDRVQEMTLPELLEEFGSQVLDTERRYQDYDGAYEYDEASKFVTDVLCGRL